MKQYKIDQINWKTHKSPVLTGFHEPHVPFTLLHNGDFLDNFLKIRLQGNLFNGYNLPSRFIISLKHTAIRPARTQNRCNMLGKIFDLLTIESHKTCWFLIIKQCHLFVLSRTCWAFESIQLQHGQGQALAQEWLKWFNFGKNLHLEVDPGIIWRIIQIIHSLPWWRFAWSECSLVANQRLLWIRWQQQVENCLGQGQQKTSKPL